MTVALSAALLALTGLLAVGPAQAAPQPLAPPPCTQLPCEGADPTAVPSWAVEPRVVNQTTLPSGAHVTLMAGNPSWDPDTEYAWVDGQLNGAKGEIWLPYDFNVFEGAFVFRNSDHPRSHRSTSGTTGMFRKKLSSSGEFAGGCISDGVDQACVGGFIDSVVEVKEASPCDPVCKVIDPTTLDLSKWGFVERSEFSKVTLPSGASVQLVTGQPNWILSPQFNWAESENLPAGGAAWLEEWQGSGRFDEVYTRLTDPRAQITAAGSTHAFAMTNVRACVTDGTDTQCTRAPESVTTEPSQAPCATLPCEGIDPSTVTEWTPNGEPRQIEDANIFQGGRLQIFKGRPAWDPSHDYYWGVAELPPRAGVSAQLMTHDTKGLDNRTVRPVPIAGASLTASGTTDMVALDPLAPGNTEIAGLVDDARNWSFVTQQDNALVQTSVQGPVGPCAAAAQPCTGLPSSSVTTWRNGPTTWKTATLASGAQVSLKGGLPTWSVSDYYASAETTSAATAWLEDRTADGAYHTVADGGVLAATTGVFVRACISDTTGTVCTAPDA